ncbi:flavin reductase family protein [Mycobacterium haemophilum]|uniref:Ferredoxin reductase n=1 Tax=Mycobacterium haemophilum TaxID=29311 RepID=A0A0I9U3G7_9MYCO|nr:iron-sulfur cluster-binding domain-containing protein [Mycobacterium haemophilum]AKN15569.1 ferredoxin reductase [Mycobacterium haemophilum DSM 44634]KLO32212.1 ferredoxin reductase [Mycobacterium haemophilum]KLO36619.1 ferredoxin reductase [Mycobacterium haemophilum]KLO42547.1 ferredoxin reductase [Mycobacterium haemophilum]KLO55424.1 ferredoxin reductase [Mycobacterium haemophilum]
MFTQNAEPSGTFARAFRKRVLGSGLVDLLTGPHGIDRYIELVAPTWALGTARAKVIDVRRTTARSVTLTLAPNESFTSTQTVKAGQYINLTVDIDGRRHTRCYSPANAEGAVKLELTIGQHDGGVVSTYLYEHARRGMIVGLAGVGGDFVLPAHRPRRILFVSAGSGITPVMAMLRTLVAEGHVQAVDREIAFVHYARTATEACYRAELAAMGGVRVLHGYTRSADGDLVGRFGPRHLAAAMTAPDVVFVCGPTTLVESVREHCDNVCTESFVPPVLEPPDNPAGGRITFANSGIHVIDNGRSLLEQAESAGLTPQNGCRMGICHTCTRRKTAGTVRNLITRAVSTEPDEDVQICVSVPVGDVDLFL